MKFPFQLYIVCWGKIYGSKIIGRGGAPRATSAFYSVKLCNKDENWTFMVASLSSAEVIMIIKCQVSVSSLLLNIPKVLIFPLPHFPACTESNGSTNKKQSKDLCGGESGSIII